MELKRNSEGLEKDTLRIILNEIEPGYTDTWFQDLFQHGCISGMVGELIYYYDTHKFALKHMEEIFELESDLEEQGIEVKPESDKLNWYAWFGFEETARKIYEQLGGEI